MRFSYSNPVLLLLIERILLIQHRSQAVAVLCVGTYSSRRRQRSRPTRTSLLIVITPSIVITPELLLHPEHCYYTRSGRCVEEGIWTSHSSNEWDRGKPNHRREGPDSGVILISQNDPIIVSWQATESGARGYIAKADLAIILGDRYEQSS
jgi:hypothetical protein